MSFDEDKVETLLQIIEGWEAEDLTNHPSHYAEAWHDVLRAAKDVRAR